MASALSAVTLESLLAEMLDCASVARWPDPFYTCVQADSMDRRRVAPDQPDWFVKSCENFVRVDEVAGRKQHVLMDVAGPGAIVRFFVTSHCGKPGKLRIYLDGSPTPVLEYRALDLLQGTFNPGTPLMTTQPCYEANKFGGTVSYLPIPYARNCKVTWEEPDGGPATPTVCYQINYRAYAAGSPVETLSTDVLARAAGAIRRTNRLLSAPPAFVGGALQTVDQTLPSGQSSSLSLPSGPAAVREFSVRLTVEDGKQIAQAMRSTVISAEFDGEQTIWCPLGDFFGAGPGLSVVQSWYRDVSADGQMVCRWVMPYAKAATITFHNLSGRPVGVQAEIVTSPWNWDSRSMHFHANWHFQAGIQVPPWMDWSYIAIKGKGIYVGDTLTVFNPIPSWYGEGTEKIWVDDDKRPSHMGTGTEDYYNFSWAPKPTFNLPFASHVRMDESHTQGHNVLTRTRNLDGITFRHSLKMDMEVHSWEATKLDYIAATYWYAFPGATSNVDPAPESAKLAIPRVKYRAITPFIATMLVSTLLPGAGKLHGLQFPSRMDSLDFKPRTFEGDFCNLHDELGAREPEDLLVYYSCQFECSEPMEIAALLGYDGPVKMWIDGKECFHDPDGVNPATAGKGKAVVQATAGVHSIWVALGSNCGKAWGIYLRLERLDLPATEFDAEAFAALVLPRVLH
jgi:hypothetical protein